MSARTRKDWILTGALGCALVGTAHAEYTLAIAAHFNEYVALAVPGALDLYVLRALQQRRDVFVAVLAMVAANVTAHLLTAGVLREHWAITSAAGALAPLILWRVYSLRYTRTRQELLWGIEAGAVSAPALGDASPDAKPQVSPYSEPSTPAPVAPEWGPRMQWGALDPAQDGHDGGAAKSLIHLHSPDHVPADWMQDEYPEASPSTPHSKTSAVPYLALVPDLPKEYETSAVHSETSTPVLRDSDWEYLPGAQEYVDKYAPATVKGLRRQLGIGQDRAERLLAHLGVRP